MSNKIQLCEFTMFMFLAITLIGGLLILISHTDKILVEKECQIQGQIVKGTTCEVKDFKNDFYFNLNIIGSIISALGVSGLVITPPIMYQLT